MSWKKKNANQSIHCSSRLALSHKQHKQKTQDWNFFYFPNKNKFRSRYVTFFVVFSFFFTSSISLIFFTTSTRKMPSLSLQALLLQVEAVQTFFFSHSVTYKYKHIKRKPDYKAHTLAENCKFPQCSSFCSCKRKMDFDCFISCFILWL